MPLGKNELVRVAFFDWQLIDAYMTIRPGIILQDRYEVIAELGEGGFATVYLARDLQLSRELAIKVLKSCISVADHERFRREAKLLASLRHNNIVSVFSFDYLDDSTPFMTAEYVQGRTLRSLVNELGRLKIDVTLVILRQCCEGLSYAHHAGIVHRDLNPGNILIVTAAEQPVVKILDFGLAKLVFDGQQTTITETGALVGSPHYMSPEAIRGDKVDARSDIYTLGCVIYECLAGRKAFDCDEALGLLYKHQNEYPPPPAIKSETDLEKVLEAITLCCLQKNPARRFQSCQEILDCLSDNSLLVSERFSALEPWSHTQELTKTRARSSAPVSIAVLSAAAVCLILCAGDFLVAGCVKFLGFFGNSLSPIKYATAKLLVENKKYVLAADLYADLRKTLPKDIDSSARCRLVLDESNNLLSLIQNSAKAKNERAQFLKNMQIMISLDGSQKGSKERAVLQTSTWQLLERYRAYCGSSNECITLQIELLSRMLKSPYQSKSDLRRFFRRLLPSEIVFVSMDDSTLQANAKLSVQFAGRLSELSDDEQHILNILTIALLDRSLFGDAERLCRARLAAGPSEERLAELRKFLVQSMVETKQDEAIALIDVLMKEPDLSNDSIAWFLNMQATAYLSQKHFSECLRCCDLGLKLLANDHIYTRPKISLLSQKIKSLQRLGRKQEAENQSRAVIDGMRACVSSIDAENSRGLTLIAQDEDYIRGWLTALDCMLVTNQVPKVKTLLKLLVDLVETKQWQLDANAKGYFSATLPQRAPDGECLSLMNRIIQSPTKKR